MATMPHSMSDSEYAGVLDTLRSFAAQRQAAKAEKGQDVRANLWGFVAGSGADLGEDLVEESGWLSSDGQVVYEEAPAEESGGLSPLAIGGIVGGVLVLVGTAAYVMMD